MVCALFDACVLLECGSPWASRVSPSAAARSIRSLPFYCVSQGVESARKKCSNFVPSRPQGQGRASVSKMGLSENPHPFAGGVLLMGA